jgi:threonine dehydratase
MLMALAADRDGVAAAPEQIRPDIRRTPTILLDGITAKLEAGHSVETQTGVGIAADATSPPRVGELAFPVARQWVERVVLVTDAAIRRAQEHLWSHARIVAEPAGACAMAAILSGVYTPALTERVGIIISGGNTVAVDFTR